VAGLVAAAAALPHLGALQPQDPLPALFATDGTCPEVPVIQTSPRAYYYGCIHHYAWGKKPVLFSALQNLDDATGAALVVLVSLGSVGGLLLSRSRVQVVDDERASIFPRQR
jgi:hypothetical protein